MKRTRILLADDHTIVSAGLRRLLEPENEVIGIVEDGLALLKAAAELRPDLVIVDIGMPLLNGLDAVREVKKNAPATKIIFLTMDPDIDVACEALQVGVSGYLLKTSGENELLSAVHCVLRGTSYVAPEIRRAMEENFIRDPKSLTQSKHLTPRQVEITQMLAEGRSMKEIANILNISFRTVRFHKYQIMQELQIKSIAELVQYAIKHSIIFPR